MQISPLDIQVLLLIADKQPGRERIDHDADAGHPRDTVAVDRLRIIQFADALEGTENFEEALHDLIMKTLKEHKRIR